MFSLLPLFTLLLVSTSASLSFSRNGSFFSFPNIDAVGHNYTYDVQDLLVMPSILPGCNCSLAINSSLILIDWLEASNAGCQLYSDVISKIEVLIPRQLKGVIVADFSFYFYVWVSQNAAPLGILPDSVFVTNIDPSHLALLNNSDQVIHITQEKSSEEVVYGSTSWVAYTWIFFSIWLLFMLYSLFQLVQPLLKRSFQWNIRSGIYFCTCCGSFVRAFEFAFDPNGSNVSVNEAYYFLMMYLAYWWFYLCLTLYLIGWVQATSPSNLGIGGSKKKLVLSFVYFMVGFFTLVVILIVVSRGITTEPLGNILFVSSQIALLPLLLIVISTFVTYGCKLLFLLKKFNATPEIKIFLKTLTFLLITSLLGFLSLIVAILVFLLLTLFVPVVNAAGIFCIRTSFELTTLVMLLATHLTLLSTRFGRKSTTDPRSMTSRNSHLQSNSFEKSALDA